MLQKRFFRTASHAIKDAKDAPKEALDASKEEKNASFDRKKRQKSINKHLECTIMKAFKE